MKALVFVLKNGSSAEFVGGFWFGQSPKCRVQGEFQRMIGPKPEGFSDRQFCLGIQALDATTRQ